MKLDAYLLKQREATNRFKSFSLVSFSFLVATFAFSPLSVHAQWVQGANSMQFVGTDNPSGTLFRTVDAYFGPDKTEVQITSSDGVNLSNSGVYVSDESSTLFTIDYTTNTEMTLGSWMDASVSAAPIVIGGVHPYKVNGVEFWDTVSASSPGGDYTGFIIMQSGSTWYGNLSMNSGTTFSADNLTANSITTTSLTATSITSGTLTVTGSTTIGGTLNMSGNRITNVADGINPTDAVNVRQLEKSQMENRAGISSVAALAGIPSLSGGDDGVLGVGVGTYKGESAIAVGASKRLSETTTFKFGVGTSSSSGDVTGSFGIGIKW